MSSITDFSLDDVSKLAPAQAGGEGSGYASADQFVNVVGSALEKQESGGKQLKPDGTPVTSKAGAIGIWQVMPKTAPEAAALAGVEFDDVKYRNDANYNRKIGQAYLAKQFDEFQDPAKALAAYNAGPGAVKNALVTAEKQGNPNAWMQYLPRETQNYVPAILARVNGTVSGGGNAAGTYYTPNQTNYASYKEPGPGATFGDYIKEVGAAAVDSVGSIGQAAGEVAAAVANKATGTEQYEGKNLLKPASEAIRGTMTEGGKQARQETNIEGSVLDLLSGDAQLPSTGQGWAMIAANGFGSLVTSFLPVVGQAGKVATLTKELKVAEAAGDAIKAAQLAKEVQAAATATRVTGAALGGAMTGGAAADEVRQTAGQQISKMSHEQLMAEVPVYAEAFARSGDQQQSRDAVVNSAARWAGGLSAIAGAAGGAFNAKVVEDFIVGKGVATIAGNSFQSKAARAAGTGAVSSLAEGGQETTEKVGQNIGENIALGRAATDNAMRNTAGDFIGGAVVGGPLGAGGGYMAKPGQPAPAIHPTLQPVAEKAAAGGILSKAAMAGNAGNLATGVMPVGTANIGPGAPGAPADVPADAPTNTQSPAASLPATDAMGERVREIEAELRGSNLLDVLRLDGLNASQVFDDLNAARNLKAPMEVRQEALSAVEELLTWAKQNQKPRGQMDTIETPRPMEKTVAEPVDQSVPSVDAVVTALRDEQISRLISDTDRQNLVGLIDAAKNPGLPAQTRRDAVAQAQEIVGRYQAPNGQSNGQSTPALTTPAASLAQASDNKASSDSQLMVAANTGTLRESEFLEDVDAPKVAIPAGKDPAFIRRRAAEIRQLVDNGFETVERAGSEFFLINSKTGQRFKLSGMADSQLARKAIADRVNALANTAAASPKNDRSEPTKAQIEAGNYKKSDVIELNGMKIKIENPKDSIRRGTSPDGEMWETKMAHHYGEFQGTLGADGDKLDVFVGPRPDSTKVYVIDQVNQDGSFDEHKVMMGFTSEEAARQGYLANYEKGWTGLGAITEMGIDEFKSWSKSRAAQKAAAAIAEKPAAKVADKPAAPIEKAVEAEPKQEAAKPAEPVKFSTYEEAEAYISAQRRAGTSISALPVAYGDGTFGIAIKGTPGYAKAEKEARKKPKKTKAAKSPKQGEIFTVKDNGQDVELTKVAKEDLPADSSSVTREGERRQLTQSDVSLLQRLATALGKEIQIFSGPVGDGFVRPEEPNTIYINEVTSINPLAVFGHELFHKIKDENPKAWEAIAKVVEANIGKEAFDKMMGYGYTEGEVLEEIVSDLGGDLLADGSFWRDVFGQIEADNGKEAKGIIAKLVAYLNGLVEQLINDIKQPGFNAQSLVKDVRAVRAAYKEGITQYLKDTAITRPALQAQILREENAIKKSERRDQPKVGIHFSKEARTNLIGSLFGTGLKGAERERLSQADDMRIKRRISFYVDEGNGITPESGVGGVAHEIKLPKLYDAAKNAEGLFKDNDLNGSESRVLDAGYGGYWVAGHSNKQGVGVILGDAARSVPAKKISAPKAVKSEPVEQTMKKGLISDEINAIDVGNIPGATMRAGILSVPVESREQANAELARIGAVIRFSKDRLETPVEKAQREYAEVEAQHKGKDSWMKAPNGSETNLNERQWVQVRTPSFKAWFGDWEKAANGNGVFGDMNGEVSVAVDANGEPLVVYHGTNKGGFAEFKTPGGVNRGDLGIFTTPNLAMAQTYYSKRGGEIFLGETDSLEGLLRIGFDIYDDVDFAELYEPDGTFVQRFDTKQQAEDFLVENYAGASPPSEAQSGYYAMFINIRNPNENDFEGAHWNSERPGMYEVVNEEGDIQYNGESAFFDNFDDANEFAKTIEGATVEPARDHYDTTDSVVREAQRMSFDGAFIRNVVDSGPGYSSYIDEASDVFVALDPSQLKSASFNNGVYSTDSADIRKARVRDIPASMDAITSADASFEFAKSKEFGTNRDFKLAMQTRTQAAAKEGKFNLEDESDELRNYLVRVGVMDAQSGLRDNANAVGWYDEKVKKALRLVGLIHPEINTDPEAKFAFIWALAVTSNGIKVNKNFELAEQVYEAYKRTGNMPTNIKAGTTQKAINKSLGLFNELRDSWGMEPLMRFMTTKLPVRDIEASSNIDITGEGKDTEVYGAAVLGPKIGNGFFMNLNGRFDQLTMDRWLMRTWGRWTGKLVDVDMSKVRMKREQLSGVIRMLSPEQKRELQQAIGVKLTVGNIDETAQAIWKASQKVPLRNRMNAVGPLTEEQVAQLDELLGVAKKNQVRESLGAELRKLGNALRGYLDGQIEAPGGSKQRNFIRSVFTGILGKMREENPDLSMADLQAVVWYPEKLLYDAAKASEQSDEGYSDDEAPDYANAAALLAAEKGVPSARIKEAISDVDYEIQSAKRARDAQRAAGGDDSEAGQTAGLPEQAAAGARARAVQEPGRVRRSLERMDVASGTDQGSQGREEDGSLNGLPRSFTVDGKAIRASHWAPAEKVAQEYMKAAGLEYNPPTQYAKVDKERATRIAAEYDRMKHDPQNPEVKATYAAMIEEVSAQYQAIIDSGFKVEFIDFAKQGDPYAASPRLATEDARKNNHMWVFSTRDGFGSSDLDVNDNPMLAETKFEISGQKALANDLFRVVHDYFGHVKEGVGFRADGEENTWRSHSAMFSPLAQRALTTETRGQNSWVNFGPFGEKNRTASGSDTHYADQKVGLLPLWVSEDGRGDDGGPDGGGKKQPEIKKSVNRFPDSPEFKRWFGNSKTVTASGEPMVFYRGQSAAFNESSLKGRYFTSDPVYAGTYDFDDDVNVLPVYIKAEKIYQPDDINDVTDDNFDEAGLLAQGYDAIATKDMRIIVPLKSDSQIKSATGNNGEYSDSPNITKSLPRPQFYSQLQRAIEGVPERLATMAAPAWKQWLEANAAKLGVKKDEVEWSGIKDYLDLQGKAKLGKDALVAYLADSGVKISETALREPGLSELPDGWYAEEKSDGTWAVYDDLGDERGSGDTEMEAIESSGTFQNDSARSGSEAKYGQYTLPGGENYREVLITLPFREPAMPKGYEVTEMDYGKGDMRYFANTPTTRSSAYKTLAEAEAELKRMTDGLKDWRATQAGYKSSHWDELNVLAHIRINDRTDADGKRVLFVEEVQSDWGQDGLKKGFGPTGRVAEAQKEYDEAKKALVDAVLELDPEANVDEAIVAVRRHLNGSLLIAQMTPEIEAKMKPLVAREISREEVLRREKSASSNIPAAPFVTKTEGWLNLALKRIAMMAVEGGYDKVAFVNGQQSAERYDLSKSIESIGYDPKAERLEAYDKNRKQVINESGVSADKLDDYIGKEVAKRLLEQPLSMGKHLLDGEDIKVGGEGMTKFYDQIVPQNLSKLLPKLGGEKMTTVDMPESANAAGGDDLVQPGFDVTDKMRETVSAGVPMFSRARSPWFESVESIKLTSGYQLGDLLNSSGKLSWWDKSVGTMYNLAQKHPEFKRVFDAVQTFIDDVSVYANRAANFAPNILPKLETWRDIGKKPLSAEDVQALRDPIFQGTLSFSRDQNGELQPEDDVSKAGVVFTDQELREYFQLTDSQIGLYREFRNAVDQSITDLALSDMLRYLGEDGEGVRERVMGAKSVDQAEREIQAHLDMLIEQQPQRAEVLTNTKEVIEDKVDQANRLMERGYAPLSRYGKYTVYVVGKNGEQEYFSMFESDKEAQKMAREMREQYPDSEVTTGTMSQESYKLFSGVTPETLALFGESMGLEENGVDEKSQAYQQYLKLAKSNRSAMKRLIQRKGIDGFSEDAGRVLAGFVYSNARQISTNLHAGEISKSVVAVKDGDVKDAAIKLMQYIQNPQEEAQALRGLMFAQFIGGSIASALVNMTQPFTMTMPYLSQFAGAVGAATRMTEAVKLVSKGITGDDDLAKALKRAEDDGVVSPQEVHQLMAQSQGKGALQSGDGTKAGDAMAKANNSLAKLSLGWGKLFGAAEQFNRRVTFIAAYKLARDQKMANPFEFAENAIRETQGVYNKGNKPQWARGAVGATLFTFKQYSVAYVEFLTRMWGNGPEGKKAVGMALLVLFLMSGLGGMPGADDLDDVIDGIAQRVFNKSFDSKQAKKEFFNKLLGETLGDLAMGGITSLPGSPIDLSGRLGLGNLIPGTGVFTKKTSYTRDAMEIAGPAGSMVSNWLTAAGQVAQGEFGKATKTVAPVAAQNLVKATDMFTMGQYRDEKGRKVIDVDAWEAVAKGIGFQPSSVKRVQEATSTQQNLIGQNKIRETEIADLWTAGRVERDQDKIERAKEQLAQWNLDNPASPIKIDPKQINRRVQQANMSKAQRIAATAPKEIRGNVKKELETLNP